MAQHRIVRTLWLSIGLSIVWVSASVFTVSAMVANGTIVFRWLPHRYEILKVIFIYLTCFHHY